jgi:hypothetical protein
VPAPQSPSTDQSDDHQSDRNGDSNAYPQHRFHLDLPSFTRYRQYTIRRKLRGEPFGGFGKDKNSLRRREMAGQPDDHLGASPDGGVDLEGATQAGRSLPHSHQPKMTGLGE